MLGGSTGQWVALFVSVIVGEMVAELLEKHVKDKIKAYLKSIDDCWFYMPVQNGMGVVGIPDIICVIDGRFVGIECKAPGKEKNVTANQQAVLNAIISAGGLGFVASDVETVKFNLKELWPRA